MGFSRELELQAQELESIWSEIHFHIFCRCTAKSDIKLITEIKERVLNVSNNIQKMYKETYDSGCMFCESAGTIRETECEKCKTVWKAVR